MKALSIRQPWAWAIIHAGKDVENRTWTTPYRGPLLIHASRNMTELEYERAASFITSVNNKIAIPAFHELKRGGIIGKVELVDIIRDSNSSWAIAGQKHWQLKNPEIMDFLPCSGQRGVFEV